MNDAYENVECNRCGHKWWSTKYEEHLIVPEYCPKCYRKSVQKIPEPPTRIEIVAEKAKEKKKQVPVVAKEKKHELVLIIENNRMMISMAATGTIITLIIASMIYLLFFI